METDSSWIRAAWALALVVALAIMGIPTSAAAQTEPHTTAAEAGIVTLAERVSFERFYFGFVEGVAAESFEACVRSGRSCPTAHVLDESNRPRTLRAFRHLSDRVNGSIPSAGDVALVLLDAGALSAHCLMNEQVGSDEAISWQSVHLSRGAVQRNASDPRKWFSHRCTRHELTVRANHEIDYVIIHRDAERRVRDAINGLVSSPQAPPLSRLHAAAAGLRSSLTDNASKDIPKEVLLDLLRSLLANAASLPASSRDQPAPRVVIMTVPVPMKGILVLEVTNVLAFVFAAVCLIVALRLRNEIKRLKAQLVSEAEMHDRTIKEADQEHATDLAAQRQEAHDKGVGQGARSQLAKLKPVLEGVQGLATALVARAMITVKTPWKNANGEIRWDILMADLDGAIKALLKEAARAGQEQAEAKARSAIHEWFTACLPSATLTGATIEELCADAARQIIDEHARGLGIDIHHAFTVALDDPTFPRDADMVAMVAKACDALLRKANTTGASHQQAVHALTRAIHSVFTSYLGGGVLSLAPDDPSADPLAMVKVGIAALNAQFEGRIALVKDAARPTIDYAADPAEAETTEHPKGMPVMMVHLPGTRPATLSPKVQSALCGVAETLQRAAGSEVKNPSEPDFISAVNQAMTVLFNRLRKWKELTQRHTQVLMDWIRRLEGALNENQVGSFTKRSEVDDRLGCLINRASSALTDYMQVRARARRMCDAAELVVAEGATLNDLLTLLESRLDLHPTHETSAEFKVR